LHYGSGNIASSHVRIAVRVSRQPRRTSLGGEERSFNSADGCQRNTGRHASDVFGWPGPAEHLTQSSERTGIENNWFALTGRIVAVKVKMDGDLHLALQDATGDKAGIVVCEIPAKQQWCSIRETVFSWTATRFPFHTSSAGKLKLIEAPIITVTGKAYWDVGHAPKDQSNRRSHLPGYAAWEIHPVMKLEVQ
jgi:hypothetical protein